MDYSSNNKRLVKNTILLYVRMLFLMLIGLYTSRVILAALGASDFGIYNVVGGVVTLFAMISGALNAAISRFLTFELGTGDKDSLSKVFCTSVTIQFIFVVILVLVAETIGLWFVNHKLVIPEDRMIAANWVYQFSIVTFSINLISVPYNSAIIAHERMEAFAYISIIEAISKLLVAWTIAISPIDRLVYYASLLMIISVVIRFIYGWYCKKTFEECKYRYFIDKPLIKRMFGFAGWNMIGATSAVCRDQGGNIILNLFGGTTVNAARGLAITVNSAVSGFVSNFQTALNPQITKNYATGDLEYMRKLVMNGSKYSYYILMFITLPVILSSDFILSIWLGEYPEHTSSFFKLILFFSLVESLSGPLMTAMYATEKIKLYQIVVGGLQLMNLPLSYLAMRLGYKPESVFTISIVISVVCLFARLILVKPMIQLPLRMFTKEVLIRVSLVSVLSFVPPYLISMYCDNEWAGFIILTLTSLMFSSISVYFVGIHKEERKLLVSFLKNRVFR